MNDPKRKKGDLENLADRVKKGEQVLGIGGIAIGIGLAVKKFTPMVAEKAVPYVGKILKRL